MKTNIFKLAFMALATTALVASCSQNEELDSTNQNNVLAVSTTIQNFVQDPKSRIIDEATAGGYETKFETGDQIGVYAIAEDGEIMCKNMAMTYNATDSKWESASPLYFYRNATYIAYSPYTAALSTQTITDVESIKTYFTTLLADATKSYSECDLMTAQATTGSELPAADASSITFNFAHAMSMVEFVIPVANYVTNAGYEYSAPIFGLKLKKKEGADAAAAIDNANALGKGVYRLLLAPVAADVTDKDLTFSGELFVGDGTQPVYFETTQAFRPTSGTYKRVNVSYTNSPDPTTVTTRDIAVGDYYYSDGGIVPVEAAVKPTKSCVGLVFSTTTSTEDQARGWTNGYVVALQGVNTNWGNYNSYSTNDEYPNVRVDADACRAFCENLNGYDQTAALKVAAPNLSIINALNGFSLTVSSDKSSGWYIPSPGQYIALFSYLGEKPAGYDTTDPDKMFAHSADRYAALTVIGNKLTAAGGVGFREFVWFAMDQDTGNGRAMQWKSSYSAISSRPKTGGSHAWELRPVLAF